MTTTSRFHCRVPNMSRSCRIKRNVFRAPRNRAGKLSGSTKPQAERSPAPSGREKIDLFPAAIVCGRIGMGRGKSVLGVSRQAPKLVPHREYFIGAKRTFGPGIHVLVSRYCFKPRYWVKNRSGPINPRTGPAPSPKLVCAFRVPDPPAQTARALDLFPAARAEQTGQISPPKPLWRCFSICAFRP